MILFFLFLEVLFPAMAFTSWPCSQGGLIPGPKSGWVSRSLGAGGRDVAVGLHSRGKN